MASDLTAAITGPRKARVQQRRVNRRGMPTSSVAFVLFLLVNATLFLRPAEMVPALVGLPIYEVLILSTCILSYKQIQEKLRIRSLKQQPITLCVVGLLPCVVISHLSHFFLWGAKDSGTEFLKILIYYILLVSLVHSPKRLRWLLLTVVVFGTIMIGLCVVDYIGWHDFEFIKHIDMREGVDLTGEELRVFRMRGTGIFQDPNDIALLVAICCVICGYFLNDKSLGLARFAWVLPILLLGVALILTRSRGGLLAVGAAGTAIIAMRYGRKACISAAILGVAAVSVIAGRQGQIELGEGTGHERIVLWREGLAVMKTPEGLLGIGQGMYADMAGLVAHNSYLHAFTELGLLGGTFFLGCFLFAGLGLYRMSTDGLTILHPELVRMRPYIIGILVGWCVGMFSLSRCYVSPTYMVAGIAASYLTMAGNHCLPKVWFVSWNRQNILRLCTGSIGLLVFLTLFVKVFA